MVQYNNMKDTIIGTIPYDWQVKKLGDGAYIKARIGWRGLSSKEYTEDGPYLIAGTHIKGPRIIWDACDHISLERYEESPEIQLKVGDVILTKDGTIGRLGYIDELPGPATINGTMMLVRPDESFYPKFLYYYFQGPYFQALIKEKVSGSSVPHIFQRDMVNLSVPVPSIKEQHKIADILTSIDMAISKTESIIEQTEKVKKGLIQQLLTKGIGHTKFKQTEIGEIPEVWDLMQLDEMSTKITDGTHQSPVFIDEGIPFLLVSNIAKGFIDWNTNKFISHDTFNQLTKYVKVDVGDILYTAVGSYGVSVVVESDNKFSFQRHIALIKPKNEVVNSKYLSYFLNSPFGKNQADKLAVGNAQKTVTLGSLSKFVIPIPNKTEQEEIVNVLTKIDQKLGVEQQQINTLTKIKRGLMQSLLTGKVRVKVDDQEAVTT
ncbi:restriction endonuclease subunit S [Paenibacillus lautus]|uniref:restriction endonuclease subunit S n=1 Tax=Paenibacillus lautus TaxID=1401 RepID=UPI002DB721A4|nr:restriction endonuclease subunit S [Paenibacillus lautus]MEC0259729.1 restriction endonuclease subunit S [Paenibacillus lautus]